MILLIEDRQNRQFDHLGDDGIRKLSEYDFLTNETKGDKIQAIKNSITLDNFEFISVYDILIIHRSLLDSVSRNRLQRYCEKVRKDLVFYSGSINTTSLTNLNGSKRLIIGSDTLYGHNLFLFLDQYNVSKNHVLEMLAFGERWRLNMLLSFNNFLLSLLHSESRWLNTQIKVEVFFDKLGNSLEKEELYGLDPSLKDTQVIVNPVEAITEIRKNLLKKI